MQYLMVSCYSLIAGIQRHGVGYWKEILDDPELGPVVRCIVFRRTDSYLTISLMLHVVPGPHKCAAEGQAPKSRECGNARRTCSTEVKNGLKIGTPS